MSGNSQGSKIVSGVAAIDLTTFANHFCVIDSSGEFTSGTTNLTAQGRVDGIIAHGDAAGRAISVVVPDGGFSVVKCGGTIAAGAEVATAADGRAIALGSSNGDRSYGVAMEAGVANRLIKIQFTHKGQVNA